MYTWLLEFLSIPNEPNTLVLVGSIALSIVCVQCFLSYFIGAFVNIFRKY